METDTHVRDVIVPGGSYAPDAGGAVAAIHQLPTLRLLSLDAHGRVLDWINWQDAACLYARDAVSWTLGEPCMQIHGGISRLTGERSTLELHPIIAARGHARSRALDPTPTLSNTALFARDSQLCMYCGQHFSRPHLTRDHVMPVSKGGRDSWENVVTACFQCNSRKANRTPQQAHMPLLAVPYRPSWIEHLILSNRNILSDQMAFLRAQLPKRSSCRCKPTVHLLRLLAGQWHASFQECQDSRRWLSLDARAVAHSGSSVGGFTDAPGVRGDIEPGHRDPTHETPDTAQCRPPTQRRGPSARGDTAQPAHRQVRQIAAGVGRASRAPGVTVRASITSR